LAGVASTDVDVQLRLQYNQPQSGFGSWVNVAGRYLAAGNEYRARVRFTATTVSVAAMRVAGGGAAVVIGSDVNLPALPSTPNTWYRVRMRVTGTNPTTIKIKVWLDGGAEPASWQVSVSDSTAGLQAAGVTGVSSYAQGSTAFPSTFGIDDYALRPANLPPTAAFAASCSALTCTVDAGASFDPDDTSIASYQWVFGDGTTATGVSAAHSYAAAGTYTITLTVTDSQGVVGVTSQDVTVT